MEIKKILIVDDDLEVLNITRAMLEKRGYEIETAVNGMPALEKVRLKRPDLILTDVLMPEMDGYVFYKELKNNALSRDIPVLILTARGNMEDSFKVIGVDGFITKPFTPDNLIAEIEHIALLSQVRQDSLVNKNSQKILAVGCHRAVLESMAHQAQKAGYPFKIVLSGAEAISEGIKFLPKICFIDICLKDMSAIGLIDILRRLPQFSEIALIGYCYYDLNCLDDPKSRQDMLQIDDLSKRFIAAGGSKYIGRYNHHVFMQTMRELLK